MRCANPKCHRESHYLRDGRLYSIDETNPHTGRSQRRFIWLCSTCAPSFVVETWRPPGEQLRSATSVPPASHSQADQQLASLHTDDPGNAPLPPRRPVAPHTAATFQMYAAARPKWH